LFRGVVVSGLFPPPGKRNSSPPRTRLWSVLNNLHNTALVFPCMDNDWQYSRGQHPEMTESPSQPGNLRRYPQQQQQQQQQHGQVPPPTTQYPATYTSPTRSAALPTSRHSITADFSGINLRDEAVTDKSSRPNLSLYPGPNRVQGGGPSSPTRLQQGVYVPQYSTVAVTRPNEHFAQTSSGSRHSSPMITTSPSLSPYYPPTPHLLNPINEKEQTMQWSQPQSQARQSPSRTAAYVYPPNRESISPRSTSQSSQSQSRHSLQHIPQSTQYSPRQPSHFPGNGPSTPNISPTNNYSPRHPGYARDPMADVMYTVPPPAKFRIVSGVNGLRPSLTEQPKHRRANPDGGFISVVSPCAKLI
jgi:hypothetical protein